MMKRTGSCLCGSVTFEAKGNVTEMDACHCAMCRRQNAGSAFIGVHVSEGVALKEMDGLSWFSASDWAERGFCKFCGSSLFWRLKGEASDFSIAVGALDDVSNLKIHAHIFTDEAPHYYTIPHDAPHKTGEQVVKEFQERQNNV